MSLYRRNGIENLMKLGRYSIELTHPDKVLFPKEKITKEDLVRYYVSVAPKMIPHLLKRPISMVRYPQGISVDGFYQKSAPEGLPKWVRRVSVERKEEEPIEMLLCENAAALAWLANYGCITLHTWLSCFDKPHIPDRMIFDLDPPPKAGFQIAVEGALALRELLEGEYKLHAYLMATGSNGLHVMVPIRRKYDFDLVRGFARSIAERIVTQNPKLFTLAVRKEARKGRLYIDVLRNGYAQTAVAPYSVRAKEKAPIAMPLFWEELNDKKLRSDSFTIGNSQLRLRKKQAWENLKPCSLLIK